MWTINLTSSLFQFGHKLQVKFYLLERFYRNYCEAQTFLIVCLCKAMNITLWNFAITNILYHFRIILQHDERADGRCCIAARLKVPSALRPSCLQPASTLLDS